MTVISQPVSACAAQSAHCIRGHGIIEGRPGDRARKPGYCQSAEYGHGQPVKQCDHRRAVQHCAERNKRARPYSKAAIMAAAALLLAGCEDLAPDGQVVANFDGADITRSEVDHERRIRNSSDSSASRDELVRALVVRRILATVAQERRLEEDPQYHFSLRRARESLLVDALRRDVEKEWPAFSVADVRDHISSHPWKYGGRRLVYLSRGTSASTVELVLDSALFDQQPPFPVMETKQADVMLWEGSVWRVERVQEAPFVGAQARDWAERQLRDLRVEKTLEKLVDAALQDGRLQYAPGYGPSAPASDVTAGQSRQQTGRRDEKL